MSMEHIEDREGKNKKCSHIHSLHSTPTRQEHIQKMTGVKGVIPSESLEKIPFQKK